MLALWLSVVSSATPVVLSDGGFSGPVRPDALAYYSAVFLNDLRSAGVKVVAADAPSDAVVKAVLSRFGESGMRVEFTVTAPDGQTLAARSMTARDEPELYEVMRAVAQELASELFKQLDRMPVPQVQETLPPEPVQPRTTVPGIVAAAIGLAITAGGGALDVHAWSLLSSVREGKPATFPAARDQAAGAKTYSIVAVVLLAAGGALAVGGLAYTFTVLRANRALLRVVPAPARGGGGVLLWGEF